MTYRIKEEYERENPLYRMIDKVRIESREGDVVRVYDIYDGNYFWISFDKLELAN